LLNKSFFQYYKHTKNDKMPEMRITPGINFVVRNSLHCTLCL